MTETVAAAPAATTPTTPVTAVVDKKLTPAESIEAKNKAADEKFRSAKILEDRINEFDTKFKDTPEDVIEAMAAKHNLNPDELADKLYKRRQALKKAAEDDAKLTPEQKELKELRALKAEQDAIKKEAEDKKKAREDEVKYNTTVTMISTSIKTALKEFGLQETPENVGWVARALQDLKKDDESIVQGKVKLGKLLEVMQKRGKTHFEWATQGYDPVRLLDMIPDDKREALLVEYLKRKGSKKATPTTPREDLGGQSPAERQIRKGMKFIA